MRKAVLRLPNKMDRAARRSGWSRWTKEQRRGVLERKYGEEERRRSIDSRRKRCPRGILLGSLRREKFGQSPRAEDSPAVRRRPNVTNFNFFAPAQRAGSHEATM